MKTTKKDDGAINGSVNGGLNGIPKPGKTNNTVAWVIIVVMALALAAILIF